MLSRSVLVLLRRRIRYAALLALLGLVACRPAPTDLTASEAHTPTIQAALAAPDLTWVSAATLRLHLHALADSQAADRLPALGTAAEEAHRDNLALLGETDDAARLELLFVSTREEMARIVGQAANGYGLPEENAAVFRYADGKRPALQHELMHVLSWRRWGTPSRYWLSEGLATYAVETCAGFDFHALAAAIRAEGRFVSLDALNSRFFEEDDVVTYLESASLVRFLHERHGLEGVKALWQRGPEAAPTVLGRPMAAVEADWLALLDATAPAAAGWEAAIRAGGCE